MIMGSEFLPSPFYSEIGNTRNFISYIEKDEKLCYNFGIVFIPYKTRRNFIVFYEINADEFVCSPFKLIDKDWVLICAPDKTKACGANAMTASWAGLGAIWHKNVATIYVRPQRYTFGLVEDCDEVSLCFVGEKYREALKLCGTKSGRDMDKIAKSGLSVSFDENTPMIEESDAVLVCKKAYSDYIKEECFDDPAHLKNYPQKDYHKMYILEIKKILIKK